MTNKQFDSFNDVPLTEPFKTFKNNTLALMGLVTTATSNLKQSKTDAENILKEIKEGKTIANKSITGLTDLAKQVRGKIDQSKGIENVCAKSEELSSEYKKAVDDLGELHSNILNDIENIKVTCEQWDSMCNEFQQFLQTSYTVLMPMAFVYFVAIWDAFITDTARSILRIHPQVISESTANIQLSKSDVWDIGNSRDVKEYLIELEVRKLDEDRRKLIDTFRDYWGIDFKQSLVNLKDIVEIRARRDIWVHNSGVVNEQYKRLAGDETAFDKGQIAEITYEYFLKSLVKLTVLAGFIHKNACTKHYSKSNHS